MRMPLGSTTITDPSSNVDLYSFAKNSIAFFCLPASGENCPFRQNKSKISIC